MREPAAVDARYPHMQMHVLVFGTLKSGFPLHDRGLCAAQSLGDYRTRKRYPLVVAGRWFAPMMFNEPGVGHNVVGEVYQVGDDDLSRLDCIESIGKPGNFRLEIEAEHLSSGHIILAFCYMKSRDLAEGIYHSGLLESYHDNRFILPEDR
jgi:gamma-glutamylaminecyclotransferase